MIPSAVHQANLLENAIIFILFKIFLIELEMFMGLLGIVIFFAYIFALMQKFRRLDEAVKFLIGCVMFKSFSDQTFDLLKEESEFISDKSLLIHDKRIYQNNGELINKFRIAETAVRYGFIGRTGDTTRKLHQFDSVYGSHELSYFFAYKWSNTELFVRNRIIDSYEGRMNFHWIFVNERIKFYATKFGLQILSIVPTIVGLLIGAYLLPEDIRQAIRNFSSSFF